MIAMIAMLQKKFSDDSRCCLAWSRSPIHFAMINFIHQAVDKYNKNEYRKMLYPPFLIGFERKKNLTVQSSEFCA